MSGRDERVSKALAEIDTALGISGAPKDSGGEDPDVDRALAEIDESLGIRRGTTPWGRPISEATAINHDPWASTRAGGPTVNDFTEVGLREADAQKAVAGLKSGRYISFEDACLSLAYTPGGSGTLREQAMRRKAMEFRVEERR